MKTIKNTIYLFGAFALTMTLSGCLEDSNVTFFEPGVYQGSSDTLSSDADALASRFQNQKDR